jgi:hypothetical protein
MQDTLTPAPQDWLDALAESDADLAAGRVVPATLVLRDLQDSLQRMQAKASRASAKAAASQH